MGVGQHPRKQRVFIWSFPWELQFHANQTFKIHSSTLKLQFWSTFGYFYVMLQLRYKIFASPAISDAFVVVSGGIKRRHLLLIFLLFLMVGNEQGYESHPTPMNQRMIDSVSTPFFVTNFPPDVNVKSLWEVCYKVGKVADVYVARKLSKLERFGWDHHLLASVARFSRDASNKGVLNKKGQVASHNSVEQVIKSNVHADAQTSSYANVLKGQGAVKTNKGSVPMCILQGKEIDNPLSLKASVFGKLRDIRLIPKLCILLKEEGFPEIVIKYVASDWVYISFVSERAIWLELVGLPCCAWNDVAVKKLASMWGDVCFIEEDRDAPLAVKRVCIKTGKPSLIHDMIKVVAQGVEYGVVVREISNWEPNIMVEGEIGSDILDLSGGEEEDAYFDDDVNDIIDVENGDRVDEGQENSFSMDNTPINGVRGAGFVDRKGSFFQNNNKRKGNGGFLYQILLSREVSPKTKVIWLCLLRLRWLSVSCRVILPIWWLM
ncbi:unnamed protein product [Lactuca virosa]|uniref:DUF4283 domain-containing protein n=1 Tax=Lactuca virosa TaxID=75947 RepID=A0AAU9LPL3_9ASTR|nr:unnamed protein product [Lactuca virosa]